MEESKQLKRPVSAYILYSSKIRADVKKNNPEMQAKEIMKKIAEMWKGLDEKQKKIYEDEHQKNKAAYDQAKPAKTVKGSQKKTPKVKKPTEPKPEIKKKAGK